MEAIRKFAGAEPEKAVVEPAARAAPTGFDDSVTHYEMVHPEISMSDTKPYPYETRLNVLFRQGETIDEKALADACLYK